MGITIPCQRVPSNYLSILPEFTTRCSPCSIRVVSLLRDSFLIGYCHQLIKRDLAQTCSFHSISLFCLPCGIHRNKIQSAFILVCLNSFSKTSISCFASVIMSCKTSSACCPFSGATRHYLVVPCVNEVFLSAQLLTAIRAKVLMISLTLIQLALEIPRTLKRRGNVVSCITTCNVLL
jgi:hypothetical protein